MSDERDELAGIIYSEEPWTNGAAYDAKPFEWSDLDDEDKANFRPLADAILAAGYRKLRQVTTPEELAALPGMSVVRTSEGTIANLVGDAAYFFGYDISAPRKVLALPATVLHEGSA